MKASSTFFRACAPGFAALSLAAIAPYADAAAPPLPDWVLQAPAGLLPRYPTQTKAVVLLDDTLISVGPDGRATERERRVIKVLRPQGREYAQIVAWYSRDRKLNSFHAWSIAPDGHQFTIRDDEIHDQALGESWMLYDDIQPAGELLLVRPRVIGSHVDEFNDKPRLYPIDLRETGTWRDSIDVALPAGYLVDDTPDPVSIDVGFAIYKSSVKADGAVLHYSREYVVKDLVIAADKYPDIRKLMGAIAADENNNVVLKKQ